MTNGPRANANLAQLVNTKDNARTPIGITAEINALPPFKIGMNPYAFIAHLESLFSSCSVCLPEVFKCKCLRDSMVSEPSLILWADAHEKEFYWEPLKTSFININEKLANVDKLNNVDKLDTAKPQSTITNNPKLTIQFKDGYTAASITETELLEVLDFHGFNVCTFHKKFGHRTRDCKNLQTKAQKTVRVNFTKAKNADSIGSRTVQEDDGHDMILKLLGFERA